MSGQHKQITLFCLRKNLFNIRCYTVVLPRSVGRREFKFIVNGQYCCDGTLSVISVMLSVNCRTSSFFFKHKKIIMFCVLVV